MLPISDVDKVKSMLLPHGGWPMAAGPVSRHVSRLRSFEPGEKTGLRLSPHLHLAHMFAGHRTPQVPLFITDIIRYTLG